jgi:cytochrome b involved in lipid metabolism
VELGTLTWEEVLKHRSEDDLWLVWGGHVYDVSSFARQHPGTLKVLLNGNGRDMSKAFEKAKHTALTKVFALNYRIGRIEDKEPPARVRRGALAQSATAS